MIVRVKLCGVTRLEDALLGVELGVDAVGFNFVEGSPRRVTPEQAADVCAGLPPFLTRVGVFADESPGVVPRAVTRHRPTLPSERSPNPSR